MKYYTLLFLLIPFIGIAQGGKLKCCPENEALVKEVVIRETVKDSTKYVEFVTNINGLLQVNDGLFGILSISPHFDISGGRFGIESRLVYRLYQKPNTICFCEESESVESDGLWQLNTRLFVDAAPFEGKIKPYWRVDYNFKELRTGIGLSGQHWFVHGVASKLLESDNTQFYLEAGGKINIKELFQFFQKKKSR